MDIVITIYWLIGLGLSLGLIHLRINRNKQRKRFGAFLMRRKR